MMICYYHIRKLMSIYRRGKLEMPHYFWASSLQLCIYLLHSILVHDDLSPILAFSEPPNKSLYAWWIFMSNLLYIVSNDYKVCYSFELGLIRSIKYLLDNQWMPFLYKVYYTLYLTSTRDVSSTRSWVIYSLILFFWVWGNKMDIWVLGIEWKYLLSSSDNDTYRCWFFSNCVVNFV